MPLRAAHEPHGGVYINHVRLYLQPPRCNHSPPSETKYMDIARQKPCF